MKQSRILSTADAEQLIKHLEDAIALFEKKPGLLTGAELRIKSLLTLVRSEVERCAVPID